MTLPDKFILCGCVDYYKGYNTTQQELNGILSEAIQIMIKNLNIGRFEDAIKLFHIETDMNAWRQIARSNHQQGHMAVRHPEIEVCKQHKKLTRHIKDFITNSLIELCCMRENKIT